MNWRIVAKVGLGAFGIALISGIIGKVGFGQALLRSSIAAVIFACGAEGLRRILGKTHPELFSENRGLDDDTDENIDENTDEAMADFNDTLYEETYGKTDENLDVPSMKKTHEINNDPSDTDNMIENIPHSYEPSIPQMAHDTQKELSKKNVKGTEPASSNSPKIIAETIRTLLKKGGNKE